MRPDLFHIDGLVFHAYRTFLAAAFLLCTLLAVRESRRRGDFLLPPQAGVWALLGALLGAKLFYAVQYAPPAHWWRAVLLWEGGLVFYGGFIGGVAALAFYLRRAGIPFVPAADIVAPYLALGEAITRIGCFLNGCCWGAVTDAAWAVRFPTGSAAHAAHLLEGRIDAHSAHALPVHPTQIYMTVGLLAVAAGLKVILDRRPPRGTVVLAYLALYGALRFAVELFRGDSARSVVGLTVSGAISLALLAAGALALARVWPRH